MFIDEVKKEFGINTPIFADELLALFKQYTRAYVFRLIKKAEKAGELVAYSRGVYFIPRKTFFGQSTICSEMVAEKKYMRSGNSVYGVCAGLNLLNQFGVTTQVPNTLEIVTNNETTRKRKVVIDGKEFVVRRARCKITSDNYPEYTLLQLFNDMDEKDTLDKFALDQIASYMKEKSVTKEKLFSMSAYFPSIAAKNMIRSGALNGAI